MELNKGTKEYALLVIKNMLGDYHFTQKQFLRQQVCKLRRKAGFDEDCQDNGINMLKKKNSILKYKF